MSETIILICDNCGAKPKTPGIHTGWKTTRDRQSTAPQTSYMLVNAMTNVPFSELDLCPQCVLQIRKAKGDGYPNAPERVAS